MVGRTDDKNFFPIKLGSPRMQVCEIDVRFFRAVQTIKMSLKQSVKYRLVIGMI